MSAITCTQVPWICATAIEYETFLRDLALTIPTILFSSPTLEFRSLGLRPVLHEIKAHSSSQKCQPSPFNNRHHDYLCQSKRVCPNTNPRGPLIPEIKRRPSTKALSSPSMYQHRTVDPRNLAVLPQHANELSNGHSMFNISILKFPTSSPGRRVLLFPESRTNSKRLG